MISLFVFTMWIVPFLVVFYYIKQQRAYQREQPPQRLNFDIHFWVWVQQEEDEELEEEKEEELKFDFQNKGKITHSE